VSLTPVQVRDDSWVSGKPQWVNGYLHSVIITSNGDRRYVVFLPNKDNEWKPSEFSGYDVRLRMLPLFDKVG
jgi:hypothetical protein